MGVYTAIAFTEISTIKTSTEFNSVLYENNRLTDRESAHTHTSSHIYRERRMREWLSGYTHSRQHSRQSFSVVLILWPHFLIINAIWINLFFMERDCVFSALFSVKYLPMREKMRVRVRVSKFILWIAISVVIHCIPIYSPGMENCEGSSHSYANIISFNSRHKNYGNKSVAGKTAHRLFWCILLLFLAAYCD